MCIAITWIPEVVLLELFCCKSGLFAINLSIVQWYYWYLFNLPL